jgi:hypothetical protein
VQLEIPAQTDRLDPKVSLESLVLRARLVLKESKVPLERPVLKDPRVRSAQPVMDFHSEVHGHRPLVIPQTT